MHALVALISKEFVALNAYWAVALFVGIESIGIPFPGETTLIAAAALAGASGGVSIFGVVAAAAAGAIVGDSIGFWIGRKAGLPLLERYGKHIGVTEARLKLARYLFQKHGGKVVFFGRFVAILRALAAFLAGASGMAWPRFLLFNATGGVLWATIYGTLAYFFGAEIEHVTGPVGIGLLALGALAVIAGFVFLKRHEKKLMEEAERAQPGPL